MTDQPLNSFSSGKVVNIADIRAQRMAALENDTIDEDIEAGEEIGAGLTRSELFFFRNVNFFGQRMSDPKAGYGPIAFKLGSVGDVPAIQFRCDAYAAIYFLKPNLIIDFDIDPLITRWSLKEKSQYPVVPSPAFTPEEA